MTRYCGKDDWVKKTPMDTLVDLFQLFVVGYVNLGHFSQGILTESNDFFHYILTVYPST
jgi:hypothetical protein